MSAPPGIATIATLALLCAGCATGTHLSPPGMKAYEVSLASDADRLAMAWYASLEGQHDAIFLRFVGTRGRPLGKPLQLSDGRRHAFEPSLQLLQGEPVVAWYEKDDQGGLRAFIARFSAQGETRWIQALSPPGLHGRNPVVRIAANGIHVAWLQQATGAAGEATLHYARLDADGAWLAPTQQIAVADADTWNLNAAMDGAGHFHLVYDARWQRGAKEIHHVEITAGGTRHALLSADDGFDSTYPDLALQGDLAALTWFDARDGNQEVYLFSGTLQQVETLEAGAIRITRTPGASIGAYVAWNAGRIGLAWCDDSGGRERVYFQAFDAQGRALHAAQALTDGRRQGLIPSIAPWRDGFAVGWNEREAVSSEDGFGETLSSFAALKLVSGGTP